MLLVLAATNHKIETAIRGLWPEFPSSEALKYKAVSFLQLMATKEALQCLTAEEVAGCVAATLLDVVPLNLTDEPIVETCGMGGDKGFQINGRSFKTINVSTLTSFVLSALGHPVVKHGSYGNTTAVGSTDAVDLLGAQTTQQSLKEIETLFAATGYYYADAHNFKTVHDLSHLLGHETINHIIGPMTLPLRLGQPIYKIMGVNDKVSPETIARSYQILVEKGLINLVNGAIVAGLTNDISCQNLEELDFANQVTLDELSPTSSVVAFVRGGRFAGQRIITPSDFGISLSWEDILVDSEVASVKQANLFALESGPAGHPLQSYLAMNAALAVFVIKDLGELTDDSDWTERMKVRYRECLAVLQSGAVRDLVTGYCRISRRISY
jgi:anthranilate phosphoribosyltransferase